MSDIDLALRDGPRHEDINLPQFRVMVISLQGDRASCHRRGPLSAIQFNGCSWPVIPFGASSGGRGSAKGGNRPWRDISRNVPSWRDCVQRRLTPSPKGLGKRLHFRWATERRSPRRRASGRPSAQAERRAGATTSCCRAEGIRGTGKYRFASRVWRHAQTGGLAWKISGHRLFEWLFFLHFAILSSGLSGV